MKKIFLWVLALGMLTTACKKDDETGIPPVTPGVTPTPPTPETLPTLEASTATATDYVVGKKVKLHGTVAEVTAGRSYFKLSDGTSIQIFSRAANSLSQDARTKLATVGQEVTVSGTFTDYTIQSTGAVVKEIVYETEADLQFGNSATPTPDPVTEIEASTATVADYVVGKKVKLHGTIAELQGQRSFVKFSDGTLIQVFTHKFRELSPDASTKLRTIGQELTVTGTFGDYQTYKQIVYESEADLQFGNGGSVTPQPQPNPLVTIEAATATVADFVVDKEVKVHGNLVRQGTGTAARSYFRFSDGTMIQLYVPRYATTLSQSAKEKFETEGQEVTVTGKFGEYQGNRQLAFQRETDLQFGNGGSVTPQPNPGTNPSQSGVFDFEWITNTSSNGYSTVVEQTSSDGVKLEAAGRTNTKEQGVDYAIQGKGLVFNGGRGHITLTFPSGVKTLSFDYKSFHTSPRNRIIEIYEGDQSSTTELDKKEFAKDESGTYTKTLDKTGSYIITIKPATNSRQFVIDNIRWTL